MRFLPLGAILEAGGDPVKKCFVKILAALLLVSMTGCGPSDPVLESLGPYESKVMYTEGEFQDYTDFGIYTYPVREGGPLKSHKYFTVVMEEDLEGILAYIDNFEAWVETFQSRSTPSELAENYQFDRELIQEGDYYCVRTKEGVAVGDAAYGAFDNYTLYFFDTETCTLYYFHNNI